MGVLTLFLGFRLFGQKAPAHTENFALAIFVEPDDRVPVLWRGVVVGWSEQFAAWLGVELGCNLLNARKAMEATAHTRRLSGGDNTGITHFLAPSALIGTERPT